MIEINNPMQMLGIETSCDETSVAVLEAPTPNGRGSDRSVGVKNNKVSVLSNIVSSQIKIHSPFGGVVPSLAAREHEKNLGPVLEKSLKKAKVDLTQIDLMAVTVGPGLEIALWKGVNFAKDLAHRHKKPLIGINHLEGHIYSNWLSPVRKSKIQNSNDKIKFPALNLIVSGGHTQLVLMFAHGKFKIIGETVDDAAGEAFDKVARMMNLGYPGGPIVAVRAAKFKNKSLKFKNLKIKFPRPMINSKNYNFSFSGLKTAVLYKIKELEGEKVKFTNDLINYICYEFQQAVIDVLAVKTIRAAGEFRVKSVLLSGGVSANKLLRKSLEKESKKVGVFYSQPNFQYTGDNAAMIALAGYYKYIKNKKSNIKIKAEPNLKIRNW